MTNISANLRYSIFGGVFMKLKKFLAVIFAFACFIICPNCCTYADEESGFTYSVIDGCAQITGYTGNPTVLDIPESIDGAPVLTIRDNAFFMCDTLTEVNLPKTIGSIGHHAFFGCTSLCVVNMPQSLVSLGMGTFSGCTSLTSIALPDTLTDVPEDCFNGCSSLGEVSLGSQVFSIGTRSFYHCESLESLYLPPTAENIEAEAFGGDSLILLGEKGSATEKYAEDNRIAFISSDKTVNTLSEVLVSKKKGFRTIAIILILSGLGLVLFTILSEHIRRKRMKR